MALQIKLESQRWMRSASCAQTDPDAFHPSKRTPRRTVAAAKQLCRSCPVAGDCLTYALTSREEFGIWGGLDEYERRTLRRLG